MIRASIKKTTSMRNIDMKANKEGALISFFARAFPALLIIAILVWIMWFALPWIEEPWRVTIWEFWPWIAGIAAVSLLLTAYANSKAKRSSNNFLSCIALAVSVFLLIHPHLHTVIDTEYPASLANTKEGLEIRVPLDGKVVVAWGGDKIEQNYHAAYPDQRWAYDLVVDPHSNGSELNQEYGCFGATVYAPIAGEIRTASDTEPDRKPDQDAPDIDAAFGNYIVMEPKGTDNRLIIAHLKSKSLLVKRGDFVAEGTPIAACGNSGNSTEPHVHIHYIELHDLGEETVMTALPLYFRDHKGSRMPTGGMQQKHGREIAAGQTIEHNPSLRSGN